MRSDSSSSLRRLRSPCSCSSCGSSRQGRAVKVGDVGLLIPVLLGLVYDNLMLGLGSLAGESAVMEALSVPRYLMHALFTPLLIIFAALSADRLDVPGYRSRERLTLWGAVAFVAIWIGLISDLVNLHLEPRDAGRDLQLRPHLHRAADRGDHHGRLAAHHRRHDAALRPLAVGLLRRGADVRHRRVLRLPTASWPTSAS